KADDPLGGRCRAGEPQSQGDGQGRPGTSQRDPPPANPPSTDAGHRVGEDGGAAGAAHGSRDGPLGQGGGRSAPRAGESLSHGRLASRAPGGPSVAILPHGRGGSKSLTPRRQPGGRQRRVRVPPEGLAGGTWLATGAAAPPQPRTPPAGRGPPGGHAGRLDG